MNPYLTKAITGGAMAAVALMIGVGNANAQNAATSDLPATVKDGKIGFALTDRHWAIYQSPEGKSECPQGFNDGHREQIKQLFPDNGVKRTVVETQLMREGSQWFPSTSEEPFSFKEAGGDVPVSGMNLDGKVKASDFTSPDGVKGIDNQLFRALGCIAQYRKDGFSEREENEFVRRDLYNRVLIEISGVDSLVNDGDVTVTTYRGLDGLFGDATGEGVIAGGTQRVDARFGKEFMFQFKGKIVDGVLTTEGAPFASPGPSIFSATGIIKFKEARFQLKLTPGRAEGVIAGYVDINSFYDHVIKSWPTYYQSFGQLSAPSLYRALRRLADGSPDPTTGEMTAISGALDVKLTQVYIEHPPKLTASASLTGPH